MNLVINSLNLCIPEPQIYTPSELESRFKKVRFIESGGEGCVYEVEEKRTGLKMALKIANNNWSVSEDNKRVAVIVSAILEHGISPHLTQIHELLTVKCAVFAHSACNNTSGFFNGESKYKGEGDGTFPRRATLMEVLEGDLGQLRTEFVGTSLIALQVQLASIAVILAQQGVISSESHKLRNILYKRLGPNDVFNGKTIIDFDFWEYVFDEYTLYLPRQKYLIKLGDYDPWIVKATDLKVDSSKMLKNYLTGEDLTLEKVKDLFKKPEDSNVKILEVYDSSKISLKIRD